MSIKGSKTTFLVSPCGPFYSGFSNVYFVHNEHVAIDFNMFALECLHNEHAAIDFNMFALECLHNEHAAIDFNMFALECLHTVQENLNLSHRLLSGQVVDQ